MDWNAAPAARRILRSATINHYIARPAVLDDGGYPVYHTTEATAKRLGAIRTEQAERALGYTWGECHTADYDRDKCIAFIAAMGMDVSTALDLELTRRSQRIAA